MTSDTTPPPTCGLDGSVFMEVIANGDAAQRVSLAEQLAAFIANPETLEAERQQVIPAALELTADPVFEVREALARGLVAYPGLHADLLFAIISDDDEIALPFLSMTPALNHWHMLAVLRVGDELRQGAVAMRPDIPAEAVGYITDSLPLAINVLLFDNEFVAFTPDQYRRLHERFGEAREMLECLLARPDLPVDIRLSQTKRAATGLQQLIIERGWIPANDAHDLVADAEENAVLSLLREAGPKALPAAVSHVLDNEMLTPSIIVRAACTGNMDVVAHTMAQLAGLSVRRARAMMRGKQQGSFRALHTRSGLPESCYWTLQACCDVAREEHEEGIRLTPDDFGRRLIEMLMTRYEALPMSERPRHLDVIGRFAADRPRRIARRLQADLASAA